MTASRRDLLFSVALVILAALVFAPALGGPWIYDDHALVEGNAKIHTLGGAATWFTTDFFHGIDVPKTLHYWRPLVTTSYAVDWRISGGAPLAFHVTNMLAHVAVTLLAFFTLRRWTQVSWAAFAAAAIWAVHPTKAENVAWISGRTDVLCMLFLLVAAAGIARRLRGQVGAGLALEALGTAGAYMCKEQAVVLPVVAAVEGWVALGRPGLDRAAVRPLLRAIVPQTIVAIAYLVVRAVALPIASPPPLALGDHVLAVLETYGRFLALTFAPHALSIQQSLVRANSYSTIYVALGALGFVATIAAIVLLRRRAPAVSVGLAFWLAVSAPTLNILQTSQLTLVSERFLYMPTLGLALVLAAALAAVPVTARRQVLLLAGALGVALAAVGVSRAADFSDETAFWKRELRLHPDSEAGLEYILRVEIRDHLAEQVAELADRDMDQATFAADVLDLFVAAAPDRMPVVLGDLDAAATALLAHREPNARLVAFGITVVIDMSPPFAADLAAVEGRIHAARAELAARRGDPSLALVEAAAEARGCSDCPHAQRTRALAEARAAALEPSHAAAQLQARIQQLSALGLWGAAYQVLQPRAGEITMLPGMATTVAKLAFRAGDTAAAADALAGAVAPEQMRSTLETWAREFGWLGPAPTSAGGPSSP